MMRMLTHPVLARPLVVPFRGPGLLLVMGVVLLLCGCNGTWNNPYPEASPDTDTLYSAFTQRPKHLDPARSYSVNEAVFTGQIYEPPLQYSYLKTPYTLEPLSATRVPEPQYLNREGKPLPGNAPDDRIAYTVYTIHLKHGLHYQPHPAFAKGSDGKPRYLNLACGDLEGIHSLGDFKHTGTREATAADFVYEIKRLADPRVVSPIYSVMAAHIVGMQEFSKKVGKAEEKLGRREFIDLSQFDLSGVQVVNRYTYTIKVHGKYPQLLYWQAMPFFAPVPKEAVRFYHQPCMAQKNIVLDWYPVGTGPYMLTVNNPNLRMVMEKNPNYHGGHYPGEGTQEQRQKGLLKDAGKSLPFINRLVFSLARENIPYWNKFLQGYYDQSGISSSSFDQAINLGSSGEASLTPKMKEKGIKLKTAVQPTIFYMGFNMTDSVVGGDSKQARQLRRAISIAVHFKDFISIFLNGRGVAAQGPVPPGIFGHQKGKAGLNHYVFEWKHGHPRRKPLQVARKLLTEAGYKHGVNQKTGKPLVLHLDIVANGAQSSARLDWYRQQFARINVQLVIRATSYNRFQDKMANGDTQMFLWGWSADYPDPENFLFLLYGPNSMVDHHGENVSNYDNPEFNRLFDRMRVMPDGAERRKIIERMVHIVRRDSPWIWGFYPKQFTLYQGWVHNVHLNAMANNTVKYRRLDPEGRARKRRLWNHPLWWPLVVAAGVLCLILLPAVRMFRRKERAKPARRDGSGQ